MLNLILVLWYCNVSQAAFQPSTGRFEPMVQLAITVDDLPAAGPEAAHLGRTQAAQKMLDALQTYRVPEVYGFVNGILAENMEERLKILSLWKKAGHLLGNHTYAHVSLSETSPDNFNLDIARNESMLLDYASTIEELKVLRFPFLLEGDNLEKRYAVRSYLARRKYRIAQVTADSEDWLFNDSYLRCLKAKDMNAVKEIKTRYLAFVEKGVVMGVEAAEKVYGSQRNPPQIHLFHLNIISAEMMGEILSRFKDRGVAFISSRMAILDKVFDEDTAMPISVGKTFYQQALESRKLDEPGQFQKEQKQHQQHREWLNGICR